MTFTTKQASANTILVVVSFTVFVAADDLTVVTTMLRQIIFDLEIPLPDDLNRAAWIVNAYLIGYVVVMPFIGRLSDILGRRAIYMAALIFFLIGSIWVPFSAPNLGSFIFGRVLTALGGGAMVPVALAIIGDVFPPERRASAFGILGAVDMAGWVWGPLFGAFLVRYLEWRWQFYLNIPLAIAGLAAAWWALGDLPKPGGSRSIDWLGAGLLTSALLTLNLALLNRTDVQSVGGFDQLETSTAGINFWLYFTAILAFALFLYYQTFLQNKINDRLESEGQSSTRARLPQPLIDLALFKDDDFKRAIGINFLVGGILIIAMVNVPLLVNVLEVDVAQAALISGYLLSGLTLSMAVAAYGGGRITEVFGYRWVTVIALLGCALGFILMGSYWNLDTSRWQMGWHLVVLGLGFGLVTAPISTAVINNTPPQDRGLAASLVIVLRLIGMSVGLSALTAWGLNRFSLLRRGIELPDLPFTDPLYQQAVIDGLSRVTVQVLRETFLISAVIALLAGAVAFSLKSKRLVD